MPACEDDSFACEVVGKFCVLLATCSSPALMLACRGKFDGHEAQRLALLKFASTLEPAYVDVELLAADFFFAGGCFIRYIPADLWALGASSFQYANASLPRTWCFLDSTTGLLYERWFRTWPHRCTAWQHFTIQAKVRSLQHVKGLCYRCWNSPNWDQCNLVPPRLWADAHRWAVGCFGGQNVRFWSWHCQAGCQGKRPIRLHQNAPPGSEDRG